MTAEGIQHKLLMGKLNNNAVVAEWLRRLTRNQIPSGSVGSNPTDCGNVLIFNFFLFIYFPLAWLDNYQFLTTPTPNSLKLNYSIRKKKKKKIRCFLTFLLDYLKGFRSVVVITCASHAQGRRFRTRPETYFYFNPIFGNICLSARGNRYTRRLFERRPLPLTLIHVK